MKHIHEEVLGAANAIASHRPDGSFTVDEVVRALPHVNESSVRTHVVSRCCVNAPKNHLHKWPYFRRIARGKYTIEPAYRAKAGTRTATKDSTAQTRQSPPPSGSRRDTIHAVIQHDGSAYVGECLEIAVVTQGSTLDEVVGNLRDAIALHLEDEDPAMFGLSAHPRVQLLYDMAVAL